MENSEKDTLPNLETVLAAISNLRQEVNARFDKIELRLTNVEQKIVTIENDVSEIKNMQFVFENEFDRLLALSYKSLELSHENRADVRIMRKEISAWSQDVMNLEKRLV